jgi:hypothetical protein
MENAKNVIELADGDVRAWIEQGNAVHIKAVDRYGDPVELTARQAKELGEALLVLSAAIE